MSELSELTAAGRSDVVPGYVLSPPRLREHGIAEDAFARLYLQRVTKGTKGLAPDVQAVIIREAQKDVRDGYFTVRMPGYDSMANSAKGVFTMFLLSLRVKHETMRAADARKLLEAGSESRITDAVYELWGYGAPVEGGQKKTGKRPGRSSGKRSSAPSAGPPTAAGSDSPTTPQST